MKSATDRQRAPGNPDPSAVPAMMRSVQSPTPTSDRVAGRLDWPRLRQEFLSADWNFADQPGTQGGELHPYPARFIPALPATALALLRPDGPVLDPFSGSGTTLQEAQRRGLVAIGNDLNPIACLISRVRTSPWSPDDPGVAERHASSLQAASLKGVADDLPPPPHIPRVDHWFPPWLQSLLAGATDYLQSLPPGVWRDRVALAISACVVRLSRQDSDTRYAAVEKKGNPEDAARLVRASMLRVGSWLSNRSWDTSVPAVVLEGDAQTLTRIPDSSIASSVFSPPYPNAYEYWLYHKYRMYWLGFDPIAVRKAEMGARPHYCRPNGLTEIDFALQMSGVFAELARVLRPSAGVIVVVGDSRIAGRWIDNGELLADVAEVAGFRLIATKDRTILRRRSSFNATHGGGRRSEHVLLMSAPT